MTKHMPSALRSPPAFEILPFSPERAGFFHDVNAAWIHDMFVLEDIDRAVLEDPQHHIIAPGGDILFVALPKKGLVGAGALKFHRAGQIELTKMGVSSAARGQKAGEALLSALIARAQEMGADDLFLLTNSACEAAIHLYEKAGFQHSDDVMRAYGGTYDRCDVAMRYGSAHLSDKGRAA